MSPVKGEKPRVLFVGGLGRSGSTLLELLLAQSPDVCAVGEVVHLWERALGADERCGCGERFTACPFWLQVGERAFGGWSTVDRDAVLALKDRVDRTRHIPRLARASLSAAELADVRHYADLYTRIYRAALEVTGARVVVDSSKHASLAFALRWAEDLDLRVLHLVRDSRAVAYSWGKQVRRPEVVDGEDFMPTFSPFEVSKLWTAQNAAFHLLASRASVLRLRYEDFTEDPAGTVRRLREFAGLPDDPEALRILTDPPASPVRAHSIAGNPLRFSGGPLQVRRDEAWRSRLPRRSRAVVSLATLPFRIRYGYLGQRESRTGETS
ncbi:sulfotransferase family protein [Micromonospora globispora]|uniref:sulfotransferase family protein n=1 Tax=Micromonospora globispora TaxID=1450148 RepID=UPI000D6FF8FA|nr:sulfotransferase [Micromonospora globispora]PWU57621.1 sulfotransferase family protein [Micromonospora globispora]RQX06964.1 sulfotransferase family protein [Micromonospora globispora]